MSVNQIMEATSAEDAAAKLNEAWGFTTKE
jgi:hypothetical protein